MNLCEAIFHTEGIPDLVFRFEGTTDHYFWVKDEQVWCCNYTNLSYPQFNYYQLKSRFEVVDRKTAEKEAELTYKATIRRLKRKRS